ncbi:unnamed protein product [Linum tenue]|uniref:Uncharacterized protein n=1 Tax=Linum tenue TaxID=586396 RepID=A0AAV0L237_9ROSI|nr:unnamed protein product [Linum tenue]
MPINSDPSTPPPTIGKIGPYTVFITPPPTPSSSPLSPPPNLHHDSPKKVVCPPAPQIHSAKPLTKTDDESAGGFFRSAVSKVQLVNSSLDEHLARLFGLNQSKYQWALDDYFETKGLDQGAKAKEFPGKAQNV